MSPFEPALRHCWPARLSELAGEGHLVKALGDAAWGTTQEAHQPQQQRGSYDSGHPAPHMPELIRIGILGEHCPEKAAEDSADHANNNIEQDALLGIGAHEFTGHPSDQTAED